MTPEPSDGAFGDAGFSLIEVLVAIVILGISIVTLVSALAASIAGSDRHNQQAKVESVVDSAVEKVKDPVGVVHVNCATTSQATYVTAAQSAALALSWPASSVQITDVKYWDGSAFGATCYDDAAHGNLALQQITITVTSPGSRADQTLAFVKE
ncbi:MAG: hypothetical protein QOI95_280 [Acidimicrobiaceae bacterium]